MPRALQDQLATFFESVAAKSTSLLLPLPFLYLPDLEVSVSPTWTVSRPNKFDVPPLQTKWH